MNNLKEKLEEFEINNIDELVDFFLTCYEYSFTITYFKENKVKPKDLFLDFANSLSYVTDLERLWYALELKYNLFLIREYPLTFIKATINKILKDINSININTLQVQTDTISTILMDEGIKGLVLRPILLIENEEENLFNSMINYVNDIYNYIDKYRKYISIKKVNDCRVLSQQITNKFIDTDTVIVELWSLLIQNYFVETFYPKIEKKLLSKKNQNFDIDKYCSNEEDFLDDEEISIDEFMEMLEEMVGELDEDKVEELYKSLSDEDFIDELEDDDYSIYNDLEEDEIVEVTATIIEGIFKYNRINEDLLYKIFEELLKINLKTLHSLLITK